LVEITVKDNEKIESALKRFRKKCEREGISKELKKRAFYEKPSLKKKKKREALIRKLKKRLKRQERKNNNRY
jgi:small subunit ribosomal protein S21